MIWEVESSSKRDFSLVKRRWGRIPACKPAGEGRSLWRTAVCLWSGYTRLSSGKCALVTQPGREESFPQRRENLEQLLGAVVEDEGFQIKLMNEVMLHSCPQ